MEARKFGEFIQLLVNLLGGLNVQTAIGVVKQDHLSGWLLKFGIEGSKL